MTKKEKRKRETLLSLPVRMFMISFLPGLLGALFSIPSSVSLASGSKPLYISKVIVGDRIRVRAENGLSMSPLKHILIIL